MNSLPPSIPPSAAQRSALRKAVLAPRHDARGSNPNLAERGPGTQTVSEVNQPAAIQPSTAPSQAPQPPSPPPGVSEVAPPPPTGEPAPRTFDPNAALQLEAERALLEVANHIRASVARLATQLAARTPDGRPRLQPTAQSQPSSRPSGDAVESIEKLVEELRGATSESGTGRVESPARIINRIRTLLESFSAKALFASLTNTQPASGGAAPIPPAAVRGSIPLPASIPPDGPSPTNDNPAPTQGTEPAAGEKASAAPLINAANVDHGQAIDLIVQALGKLGKANAPGKTSVEIPGAQPLPSENATTARAANVTRAIRTEVINLLTQALGRLGKANAPANASVENSETQPRTGEKAIAPRPANVTRTIPAQAITKIVDMLTEALAKLGKANARGKTSVEITAPRTQTPASASSPAPSPASAAHVVHTEVIGLLTQVVDRLGKANVAGKAPAEISEPRTPPQSPPQVSAPSPANIARAIRNDAIDLIAQALGRLGRMASSGKASLATPKPQAPAGPPGPQAPQASAAPQSPATPTTPTAEVATPSPQIVEALSKLPADIRAGLELVFGRQALAFDPATLLVSRPLVASLLLTPAPSPGAGAPQPTPHRTPQTTSQTTPPPAPQTIPPPAPSPGAGAPQPTPQTTSQTTPPPAPQATPPGPTPSVPQPAPGSASEPAAKAEAAPASPSVATPQGSPAINPSVLRSELFALLRSLAPPTPAGAQAPPTSIPISSAPQIAIAELIVQVTLPSAPAPSTATATEPVPTERPIDPSGRLKILARLVAQLESDGNKKHEPLARIREFVGRMQHFLSTSGSGRAAGAARVTLGNISRVAAEFASNALATLHSHQASAQTVVERGFTFEIEVSRTARVKALLSEFQQSGKREGVTVTRLSAESSETIRLRVTIGGTRGADPIMLDLNRNGEIDLTTAARGRRFDLTGDGKVEQAAFVADGDAVLALDRNRDGVINGGRELFGDHHGAKNGLEELGRFDLNRDGMIDSKDPIYSQLVAYYDVNRNGIVGGEFRPLDEVGVERLLLEYKPVEILRPDSNVTTGTAGFEFTDGTTADMVEVDLIYE